MFFKSQDTGLQYKKFLAFPWILTVTWPLDMVRFRALRVIFQIMIMLSLVSHLKCFVCEILLQYKTVFYFKTIYSCDAKLNFQQPLLQTSVSHDRSEIILICRFGTQEETFVINYHCCKSLCSFFFLETMILFLDPLNE